MYFNFSVNPWICFMYLLLLFILFFIRLLLFDFWLSYRIEMFNIFE